MNAEPRLRRQMLVLVLVGLPVAMMALGTTCPPPPPALSVAVTANPTSGSPPLTVLATATPTGGTTPYTFAWTSAPGGLIGAPTSSSTNVTFAIAGTYTVTCTVTDSAGQTATNSAQVVVSPTPPPTTKPQLFISNVSGSVTSYTDPSTVNGNIAPNTNLAGANTQLFNNFFLVVDSAKELIVSNRAAPGLAKLTEYDNAPDANGNLAPNRNVTGGATQLNFPTGVAYDKTRDILYVANFTSNNVLVFPNASTASFNGNLAPTRTFDGGLSVPQGISLDQNGDNLYVANQATSVITIYASPSTLNGTVTPTRTITGNPAFTGLFDVFVDGPNDRLYAVNSSAPQRVNMFASASTLNGVQPPTTTLTIPGVGTILGITVDSGNHGFISDFTANRIYGYDTISSRNGTVTPDRTITGANTQLANPCGLFVLE
jgi:PKD repeat protein